MNCSDSMKKVFILGRQCSKTCNKKGPAGNKSKRKCAQRGSGKLYRWIWALLFSVTARKEKYFHGQTYQKDPSYVPHSQHCFYTSLCEESRPCHAVSTASKSGHHSVRSFLQRLKRSKYWSCRLLSVQVERYESYAQGSGRYNEARIAQNAFFSDLQLLVW